MGNKNERRDSKSGGGALGGRIVLAWNNRVNKQDVETPLECEGVKINCYTWTEDRRVKAENARISKFLSNLYP